MKLIDQELAEYIPQGVLEEEITSNISHIHQYPFNSKKEQFILLSTISNYHWYKWTTAAGHHVRYTDHLLHDPTAEICEKGPLQGCIIRKYIPTSPRNRIMYYASMQASVRDVDIIGLPQSVKTLLKADNPREEGTESEDGMPDVEVQQPPRKKRKHSTRLITATRQMISEEVHEDLDSILNCASNQRSLYTKFTEELVNEGIIRWRLHEGNWDICVMTDINSSTGALVPNAFAHVSCKKSSLGEILLRCSCAIYNLIQRAAHQGVELCPEEEGILDENLTCMHCRFFREYLMDAYEKLGRQNTGLSRVMSKVQESLQYMNNPVQLLGGVYETSTTKFSVKGRDNYSVIHLSFLHGKCYVKCMEALCAVKMQNRKKLAKEPDVNRLSMKDKRYLCPHLLTLYGQLPYVQSFFPGHFEVEDGTPQPEEEEEEVSQEFLLMGPAEDMNTDDANVADGMEGNFNLQTGLWEYKSHSKHIPHDMKDPLLVENTQMRNDVVRSQNMDPGTGLYGPYNLVPSTFDAQGNLKKCRCGIEFPADPNESTILKGTATLYTRMGPVKCFYFDIKCNTGTCFLSYIDEAEEKGIFFYSKMTAAGEEIGWDFVHRVMKSKTSFSSYCSDMTRIYETNNSLSAPFLSAKTFIKWFFGWLAAFKIDFRKHGVDPWCKHSPKILACDGTHIGVSLRNLQLEKPVEIPDVDTVLKPIHKRYDRVLLKGRTNHHFLKYLTKKHFGKLEDKEIITEEEEERRRNVMITTLHEEGSDAVTTFILTYVQKTQDEEVIFWMGRLLSMLSGDACMSSVAPFASHELIRFCCENIENYRLIEKPLEDLKRYSMEMSKLLKLGIIHECADTVAAFLLYLVNRIEAVHEDNRPVPRIAPIPNTYNPRSGTAYYFTDHGNQLRIMPDYQITGKTAKKSRRDRDLYDDYPEIDKACRKMFPEVSFGGFGHLFLWFCPIHGHCYGMHLIAGSEGRKDPFSSLYKYIEKPPEHIFYDFACQLSEYCNNREPEMFKNTRFWHDLFHAVTHVCGFNFKSGRIEGLEGINTEICEQVNSFLQCVKYTASHLSQDHFMFFLQFFLYIMNTEKTQRFRQQASIALAGQM